MCRSNLSATPWIYALSFLRLLRPARLGNNFTMKPCCCTWLTFCIHGKVLFLPFCQWPWSTKNFFKKIKPWSTSVPFWRVQGGIGLRGYISLRLKIPHWFWSRRIGRSLFSFLLFSKHNKKLVNIMLGWIKSYRSSFPTQNYMSQTHSSKCYSIKTRPASTLHSLHRRQQISSPMSTFAQLQFFSINRPLQLKHLIFSCVCLPQISYVPSQLLLAPVSFVRIKPALTI